MKYVSEKKKSELKRIYDSRNCLLKDVVRVSGWPVSMITCRNDKIPVVAFNDIVQTIKQLNGKGKRKSIRWDETMIGKLSELINKNISNVEIGEMFGVSAGVISKAKMRFLK